MAKEDPPGLLSRMVRMVRPAGGVAADEPADDADPDSGLGRQALKEMVERRRRNDFVRQREFDQLRKLRRAGHSATAVGEAIVPNSFIDSTLGSRPHDREVTLRKIDEIEEQMSRQWWKAKPGAGGPPGAAAAGRPQTAPPAASALSSAAEEPPPGYDALAVPVRSFAITAIDAPASVVPAPKLPDLELLDAAPVLDTRTVDPAAVRARQVLIDMLTATLPDYVHEPMLEEPAIRFANGDVAGAEHALQALLGERGAGEHRQWWAAVFDFYRAIGRHDRYESVAIEFAQRFGRSPPVWFSLAVQEVLPLGIEPGTGLRWYCPESLDATGVASLTTRTESGPQPWHLDWSSLRTLEDDAAGPMLALFSRWSERAVTLRFSDIGRLSDALHDRTPESDAEANPAWWKLRMELLRMLKLPDDFERVAVDYCITYEVSPPSWQAPRCDCSVTRADASDTHAAPLDLSSAPAADGAAPPTTDFMATVPMVELLGELPTVPAVVAAALSGELTGGAEEALVLLDQAAARSPGVLVVDCGRLARIDFGAAGSLLNWVATHHGDGLHVQFRDLHRMVAAFFTVIGIHEYARLHVRID